MHFTVGYKWFKNPNNTKFKASCSSINRDILVRTVCVDLFSCFDDLTASVIL